MVTEKFKKDIGILAAMTALGFVCLAGIDDASAQTRTPTRPAGRATPTPTPRPLSGEAIIISRAEDLAAADRPDDEDEQETRSSDTVEELRLRIAALEAERSKDTDAIQRRLMMNLDILSKSEQRSDLLRKQLFEMIEKENSVVSKLDSLQIDIRPEMIERSVAVAGSLRPEELRESRRRQLESEINNLQSLLTEIRRNRSSLELNLQKADDLTERLRNRVEREIEKALDEIENDRP
ncbi:MAG: hypothetical protein KF855_11020 [Acidobacteria bacterium]|nr:hypothetical protein [Acidobacteriota bacterium]